MWAISSYNSPWTVEVKQGLEIGSVRRKEQQSTRIEQLATIIVSWSLGSSYMRIWQVL